MLVLYTEVEITDRYITEPWWRFQLIVQYKKDKERKIVKLLNMQ